MRSSALCAALAAALLACERAPDAGRAAGETPGIEALEALNELEQRAIQLWIGRQWAQAEAVYRELAVRHARWRGPENLDTARAFYGVGAMLLRQGRVDEAEEYFLRSLAIRERRIGREHRHLVHALNELAVLRRGAHRYAEAEEPLRRVLSIQERRHGPHHPRTADALHQLAHLAQRAGRYAEAESLNRRILAIRERELGAAHRHTAWTQLVLGEAVGLQGRHAEAAILQRRALAVFEELRASEAAAACRSLAEGAMRAGDPRAAEALARRALALLEAHPAEAEAGLESTLHVLAHARIGRRDAQGAREAIARAQAAAQGKPRDPLREAGQLDLAGRLLALEGRRGAAREKIEAALRLREATLGADHPETARTRVTLAGLSLQTLPGRTR